MADLGANKQPTPTLPAESQRVQLRSKRYALLFILFFTLFSGTIAWHNDRNQFNTHQQHIYQNLVNATHTAHAMIQLRLSTYQDYLHQMTQSPVLQRLIKQQLLLKRDRETLLNSATQQQLRSFFEEHKALSNLGFFIIAPDKINIASRRDNNVGAINLIALQKPTLFSTLMNGQPVLVPPLQSDVPLPTTPLKQLTAETQTMFVAEPIIDPLGNTLAIVTLRIDPYLSLDPITHISDLGQTSKTLLFTDQGQLLTELQLNDIKNRPSLVPAALLEQIARQDQHEISYTDDQLQLQQQAYYSAWHWDADIGIGIATLQSKNEALARYYLARNTTIIYYLATLLLALIMLATIISTQKKSDRIQALTLSRLDDMVKQRTRELDNSYSELKHSKENIEKLFQAMPDALLVVNDTGRVIRSNTHAEELFGYTETELHNILIDELIPEGYHPEPGAQQQPIDGAPTTAAHELSAVAKNGQHIPIEITLNKINLDGQAVVTATLRDIRQRKYNDEKRQQLETQLRQTQKLEAIGQLTGGIAHDFNNLLASILGHIDLSQRRLPKGQAKIYALLNEAKDASYRARELVKQMLMFSRGDTGQPTNIDLGSTVNDILTLLRPTIPSSIQINKLDYPRELVVHSDPTQLQQIIMNIVINARDAMPKKGNITIHCQLATRQGQCSSCHDDFDGQWTILSIQDNGPGIPEDIFHRIFDPFFTTKSSGSGMGLSIVHGIMHSAHGHIMINSDENGTCFELLFPTPADTQIKPLSKQQHHPELSSDHSQHHILIVDDEEMLTRLLTELLSGAGFHCHSFNDSPAALAEFMRHPNKYDLIITDQTMPELTGSELARQVLAIKPKQGIILYSGYSEQIDADGAEALGIRAYLAKPFSNNHLLQLAEEIIAASI